jgi:hypothetical protein
MAIESSHIENVYAFDERHEVIYIGDVRPEDNGIKKMYYCLGCKKQMQAIKPKKAIKEHFRHHVKPNSAKNRCTYSDENYRHYLAKSNAIDLKKIKVPAIYKFPPKQEHGEPKLLQRSKFIEAHEVLLEHYVYENDFGDIVVAKGFSGDKSRYLLIKPDALFLDKSGKPILLIEFVVTHKPDQDKMMKFKRIGIDAIQVSVPKSSPEEIRDIFFKTTHTKWLFNNYENTTEYNGIPSQNAGGISEIDVEQRKFFEEGFTCRKAYLGDFIRSIERILESEQYKSAERHLNSEIQRVEVNTKRAKSELDEYRNEYSRRGIEWHRGRREELIQEEGKFQKYFDDLEDRYLNKIEEIRREENAIIGAIEQLEFENQFANREEREIERIILNEENDIREEERAIEDIQIRIRSIGQKENQEFGEITKAETRIEREIELADVHFVGERESMETDFKNQERGIIQKIAEIESDIGKSQNKFDRERKQLEERYRTLIEILPGRIQEGNFEGFPSWFTKEYNDVGRLKQCLEEYILSLKSLERIEQKERDNS